MYGYVYVSAQRPEEGVKSPVKLELREAVSRRMWELETELKRYGGAGSTELLAPGPLPHNYFKEKVKNKTIFQH